LRCGLRGDRRCNVRAPSRISDKQLDVTTGCLGIDLPRPMGKLWPWTAFGGAKPCVSKPYSRARMGRIPIGSPPYIPRVHTLKSRLPTTSHGNVPLFRHGSKQLLSAYFHPKCAIFQESSPPWSLEMRFGGCRCVPCPLCFGPVAEELQGGTRGSSRFRRTSKPTQPRPQVREPCPAPLPELIAPPLAPP